MAQIKVRNRKTGQTVLINWDSPRPPSGEEIEMAVRAQNEPPRGMEPPVTSPTPRQGAPQAGGPYFDVPPAMNTAPRRTRAGLGDLEIPSTGQLLRGAAARAVGSALNTPIAERLGAAGAMKREEERLASYPQSAEAEAMLAMSPAARKITPAHALAAASLPVRGTLSVIGNAPLAAGGVARMMDPEASGWEKAGGGLEAALSLIGLRNALPPRPKLPYQGGTGGAPVQQFGRVPETKPPDLMPPGVKRVSGGPSGGPPPAGVATTPRIPYGSDPTLPTPAQAAADAKAAKEAQRISEKKAKEVERLRKEAQKKADNAAALTRIEAKIEKAGLKPQGTSISLRTSAKTGAPGETVGMTTKIGKPKKGKKGETEPVIPQTIARQGPPDEAAGAVVSQPTPPPSPAPGAASAPLAPDLAATLNELGIPPEAAARMAPEELLEFVRKLRAQTDTPALAPTGVPGSGTVGEALAKGGQASGKTPIIPVKVDPSGPHRTDMTPGQIKANEMLEYVERVSGGSGQRGAGAGTLTEPSLPQPVKPGLEGARTLMSPEEAAKRHGVSTKTIMRALRSGSLPASKVGRQWRIAEDDLKQFASGSGGRSTAAAQAPPTQKQRLVQTITGEKLPPRQTRPDPGGKGRMPSIDAVIRGDERLAELFSGLNKSQRAAVYREFAGRSKEEGAGRPDLLEAVIEQARQGRLPGQGGSEAGFAALDVPSALWEYPALRAAIGGTAGYMSGDEESGAYGNQLTRGLLGALGGVAAGKGGGINTLRTANRLMYEAMLAGPAQATNVAGNIGNLVMTPVMELSRGNVGTAQRLAKNLIDPDTWRAGAQGLRQGWSEQRPVKYTGEQPMGPAGRALNATDRALRNMLERGGLSPEMAEQYSFVADPSTQVGKGLQMIQQAPGGSLMTPFIRTLMKQAEVGAAHTPLRYILANADRQHGVTLPLVEQFPTASFRGQTGWRNPYNYTAMLPGLAVAGAGYAGYGSTSPTQMAALGGLSAPFAAARVYRDAALHGRTSPSDIARATAQQIPIASDLLRIVEDPAGLPGNIARRFIPTASMAFGDKTVRDPRGEGMFDVEGYLKERLPWEREDLPIRPDFFGQPQERNILGGLPAPLVSRDPRAAALAEMGLLRWGQSPGYGDVDLDPHESSRLQQLRGQGMMQVLDPILQNPQAIGDFPDTVAEASAGLSPEQAAVLEDLLPSGMFRTKEDIYRFLQQRGIDVGTLQFRAERLRRLLGGEGGQ